MLGTKVRPFLSIACRSNCSASEYWPSSASISARFDIVIRVLRLSGPNFASSSLERIAIQFFGLGVPSLILHVDRKIFLGHQSLGIFRTIHSLPYREHIPKQSLRFSEFPLVSSKLARLPRLLTYPGVRAKHPLADCHHLRANASASVIFVLRSG